MSQRSGLGVSNIRARHTLSPRSTSSMSRLHWRGEDLLIKHVPARLPLWLDKRRAGCRSCGIIQDSMRCEESRCQGPSVEDLWKVPQNNSGTRSRQHLGDSCKLSKDLMEWFIDILLAFEANPQKRVDWAHTVVLRPKPIGGYHTQMTQQSHPCESYRTMGARARCGLPLGPPGQGMRPPGLGALHHGGSPTLWAWHAREQGRTVSAHFQHI